MTKWFIVRFGMKPSPAFWDSTVNGWTTRRATPYETKEIADAASALFDFVKISGRMQPTKDSMGEMADEVEVVVLPLEEVNRRYGPIDEAEPS